jgi:hypothetical protein
MQILSKFKRLFTAGLLLLLLACNAGASKDKGAKPVKDSLTTLPAMPAADTAEKKTGMKKCFLNDGLKYKTVVTLLFYKKNGTNIVSGNVTSEELSSGKTERGVFEGTIDGEKLMVKIFGNPPKTGDASEWTDKPWTIKATGGKEMLLIVFNAKNYDTNKWEDTEFQFVQFDCK